MSVWKTDGAIDFLCDLESEERQKSVRKKQKLGGESEKGGEARGLSHC